MASIEGGESRIDFDVGEDAKRTRRTSWTSMGDAPPSYQAAIGSSSSSNRAIVNRTRASLASLPIPVLLRVLLDLTATELHVCSRRVCRSLYLASMNLLRQHFEPSFSSHVRFPFTSDPLGRSSPFTASSSADRPVVPSPWRETRVLDLYIARLVHQLVLTSESDLHLAAFQPDDESSPLIETVTRDLFDFEQPQARSEDLFMLRARRRHLINEEPKGDGVRGQDVAIRFSLKKVALVLPCSSTAVPGAVTSKVVAEVTRNKTLALEPSVDALVQEVDGLVAAGLLRRAERPGRTLYERVR